MDTSDRQFFIMSILSPLILWWVLIGRKKYGMKGMTQR